MSFASRPPQESLVAGLVARGALWRGTSGAGLPAQATGITALDTRLPGGGWPAGALSELLIQAHGIGELGLALPLLARLTKARQQVTFVAPPHIPYAPALAQAGVLANRVLVIEPKTDDEALWAAEQLLRTPAFGAVLGWLPRLNEAAQRRLQLAAESSGSVGLIIRPLRAATQSSLSALRLKLVREHGQLQIEILKARGGRAGARFAFDEIPAAAPALPAWREAAA
jgi:hypothetical protein